MRILVAGYSVRHIVSSAARAGHTVFAADSFCDLDLEACAHGVTFLPQDVGQDKALQLIRAYVEECEPEAVVLGPGLEEARAEEIAKGIRVLNNPQDLTAMVSDKLWMARWLEEKGFPFIPTQQLSEDDLDATDVSFPAVIKPRKGAGGVGCRLVKNGAELIFKEGMIIQDFICGRPASVSVIGTGHESRAVAVNEQLIGAAWTGAERFRYSGNITPFDTPSPDMARMAEEIVSELGLKGSNGVDLLLTEEGPFVLEVNARFQGSLDTVELSTGINIFEAHLQSFTGELPKEPKPRQTAGRAILFAQNNVVIPEDFGRNGSVEKGLMADRGWITDIPRTGSEIKKSDPIASVLAAGGSREEVLGLLTGRSAMLLGALRS